MINKKILIIGIAIMFVSLVTAGIALQRNLTLPDTTAQKLGEIGINQLDKGELNCKETMCFMNVKANGISFTVNTVNYISKVNTTNVCNPYTIERIVNNTGKVSIGGTATGTSGAIGIQPIGIKPLPIEPQPIIITINNCSLVTTYTKISKTDDEIIADIDTQIQNTLDNYVSFLNRQNTKLRQVEPAGSITLTNSNGKQMEVTNTGGVKG